MELYTWGWKIVKKQFVEVLQYVQKTEDVPVHDKFLDGLIAVVHKKGDTKEIKNYRPLTLLNVDYKIYAKVIANRLMSKAQEIFNETQYALRGRSIFDLMTYIRDLTYRMRAVKDSWLISIDYKKAFDSIRHKYLFKVMERMNFGDKFITMIKNLYKKMSSAVILNGCIGDVFAVLRGIRQGCSLSMILFCISLQPLLITLEKDQRIVGINGLGVDREQKVLAFADDTTMTLRGKDSIDRTYELLKLFKKISGLAPNMQKTKGTSIGMITQLDDNQYIDMWKENRYIKIFNILFGHGSIDVRNWEVIIQRFRERLTKFKGMTTDTSIEGRLLIIKQCFLPLLTAVARLFLISEENYVLLNKITSDFIMNKKPHNEHTEMNLLASTKDKGGMNAIDIGLHARSLFVYPITKYIQYKVMQNEIPNYMQWLKNKIGEQITRKLEGHNINIANSLYRSSNVYNQMLSTYFNVLRITEPCMNPNQVYLKAIENSTNSETNRILREHDNIDTLPAVHNAILPNNIKEFNYKFIYFKIR